MDTDILQRMRLLENENEQQRAELTALRETLDSLAKHVCISSDEFLAEWSFEYGRSRPHIGRQLERTINRFTCNVAATKHEGREVF